MSHEQGGDKQPGFKVSAERLLQAINGGGTFELADFSPEEIEATLRLAASALRSSGLANEDETPRTAHEQVHGVRPSVSGNDSFHFVSATFARQLERELAEMTRYRDMNNAELGRMTAKCNALLDARSARLPKDAEELLRWLDRKGGLGLDVHERIAAVLREYVPGESK